MGVQLTKDSIDLGIIIQDSEKQLAFYRDTLGFEHVADTPTGGGGTMHRLMCGSSMIKLVNPGKELPKPAPGGMPTPPSPPPSPATAAPLLPFTT